MAGLPPRGRHGGGGTRRWVPVPRSHVCHPPGMLVPPWPAGVVHRDRSPAGRVGRAGGPAAPHTAPPHAQVSRRWPPRFPEQGDVGRFEHGAESSARKAPGGSCDPGKPGPGGAGAGREQGQCRGGCPGSHPPGQVRVLLALRARFGPPHPGSSSSSEDGVRLVLRE